MDELHVFHVIDDEASGLRFIFNGSHTVRVLDGDREIYAYENHDYAADDLAGKLVWFRESVPGQVEYLRENPPQD